jgi:hypothetical protein
MNKRTALQATRADLSSRRSAEDAIESTKQDRDLTWEEAARRADRAAVQKWDRRAARHSEDESDKRHPAN